MDIGERNYYGFLKNHHNLRILTRNRLHSSRVYLNIFHVFNIIIRKSQQSLVEVDKENNVLTMASYTCELHHRWCTQAAWANNKVVVGGGTKRMK